MSYIIEDATKTAAKIRKELKRIYPGTKFSVCTDKYSMGSSVRVRWTDGPQRDDVDRIVKRFEGAEFDGMQDLKTYRGTA